MLTYNAADENRAGAETPVCWNQLSAIGLSTRRPSLHENSKDDGRSGRAVGSGYLPLLLVETVTTAVFTVAFPDASVTR